MDIRDEARIETFAAALRVRNPLGADGLRETAHPRVRVGFEMSRWVYHLDGIPITRQEIREFLGLADADPTTRAGCHACLLAVGCNHGLFGRTGPSG